MIAISTIWNSLKHEDGAQLLAELNNLGFNAVQLDCKITEKLLTQMESQIRIGMKVVSVHNFCPVPPGVLQENADADLFLLSSPYKDKREEAVKHTLRTIEVAADLEVPVVVLHLGYVDVKDDQTFSPNFSFKKKSSIIRNTMERKSSIIKKRKGSFDESKRLFDLYEWGEREFEAFGKLVTELRGKRERKQQRYQDAVLFSLDKLNRRAMDLNILLGLENRPRYHQIPDFYELELFFAEFEGGNLRYWHDTGHAAIQEKVGILKQEKWLKTYSEQLIGIELHDVKELDEYLAPGMGELDFKEILRYVPGKAVKVLEIKEAENEEEIIEGRRVVEEILGKSDAAT
ncbi:sugar phosphate isomerase/epimerase [Candidatus Poribacteria bacterium]|nr:sugar phosphate isomerase/epimerase [Candidatus Poribacteria bacterium]